MNDVQLLAAVYERQGECNAKLEHLTSLLQEQTALTARHGKRITVLERKWTKLFSWVTVLGTGITAAASYLFRREA